MPNLARGDVVLVRFPNADLVTYRRRPALVIQANDLRSEYDDWIVAMITSRPRRRGATTVHVSAGSESGQRMGLPIDSLIILHRIATIPDIAVERKLGECPLMDDIDAALRRVFDLL